MSHVFFRPVRWSLLIALSLVLTAVQGTTTNVQAAGAPLFVELGDVFGGDIFSYTGAGLKNITGYGYNGVPILSPDGKTVAYSSYAKTYVDEQFGGNGRSGPPAINIWVMDAATGNAKRVADQPADNRTQGEGRVRPFIARSDPRWSPDSQSLVWLEQAEGTKDSEDDQNDHLMLYQFSNSQTKAIYKQAISGAGSPNPVEWTAEGISVIYLKTSQSTAVLRILDESGKIVTKVELNEPPVQVQWLNGEASPTVITANEVIGLDDDSRTDTLPPLEIYSLSAPDGVRFVSDGGYFDASWSLAVPGADPVEIGTLGSYAISPDGKMAAYTPDDGSILYVFDGKKMTQVKLGGVKVNHVKQLQVNGMAWSALGIRIQTES